jgi:hypothetical protein
MNDEQMQSRLDTWFGETNPTPPDARQTAFQVMTRVPQTRQRGRWWPLPAFHRKTQTPTATDTSEYQLNPVPATNGHAPTVIGRTQTMFSPVKAITAGALVFALGGVLLIAQPFDQQGSVPGAEQDAEPPAPVYVTTIGAAGFSCVEGSESSEVVGPIEQNYGLTCNVSNVWSDPRLEGTETYVHNRFEYMDDSGLSITHYVHDIVTDDGAWRMRPQFRIESTDTPGDFVGTWVLDGEGAYEGLSVVLDKEDPGDLHGYIVSSDLVPPPPEEGSTK